MKIQWYPGHMTKAKRAMAEDVKIIDLIIEMTDARAPLSTRNPDIDQLGQGKARLIILNKADAADERANRQGEEYFQKLGYECLMMDSREKKSIKKLMASIDKVCEKKKERDRKRGILNRPIRAMVTGIPNVGKSTLIPSQERPQQRREISQELRKETNGFDSINPSNFWTHQESCGQNLKTNMSER